MLGVHVCAADILDLRRRHVGGAAVASEADEARTQASRLLKLPGHIGVEGSERAMSSSQPEAWFPHVPRRFTVFSFTVQGVSHQSSWLI